MQNNKIHSDEITKFGVETEKFGQYGIWGWRKNPTKFWRLRHKAAKLDWRMGSSTCGHLWWPTPGDFYDGFLSESLLSPNEDLHLLLILRPL